MIYLVFVCVCFLVFELLDFLILTLFKRRV